MIPINATSLFAPSAIALIGASRRPGSVGAAILRNLIAAGGPAKIIAVNLNPIVADGAIWCGDAATLPKACELAILCVPAAAVVEVIAPYFNAEVGVRYDIRPDPSRIYIVAGIEGMAPYWFEVSAQAFVSNRGELSARLEGSYDLRVT